MVPTIDIGALFGPASAARAAVDRAIMAASTDPGFMIASGLPPQVPVGAAWRREVLRIFELPQPALRKLWRQKFDPAQPNVYRGWFPAQPGFQTYKEGIDLGADVAYGASLVHPEDPLREATPLPPESLLPGWRRSIAMYYRGMELASQALMRAIARGLGLHPEYFDAAFHRGLSTLRLIRYPPRPRSQLATASDPDLWVDHGGERRYLTGAAHADSGFLTLLAQDEVPGLQACDRGGAWVDVPPREGSLAVNFGKVLEHWTCGRMKASLHRVIGMDRERRSIPFFYEARADALISPLPLADAAAFEPFLYGDYLWRTTTQFVEFKGLEPLRKPLRR